MGKTLKAYLFIFAVYIVLYVNYFIENNNIHNITIVLLWANTIFFLFGAIGSLFSKDKSKPKSNNINKVIIKILISFAPLVMIYFGDIFMGIIYGVSLFIVIKEINLKNKLQDVQDTK